ncbi:hypothetical protein MBOURGENBZM_14820 [Methanoculleus bourgensis]|nr:hypothetical protein MBOURGENBZM_14820 [Methanoculleus bourgensis]
MSVLMDAEYPPAHPGRGPWWASPWGVGTGEGARPLPAGGGTANPPPRPARGAPPPPPEGAVPRGKPRPGTMNFWCEPVGLSPIAPDKDHDRFPRRWTIDRRLANSAPKQPSSAELGGILVDLHTKR